MPEIAIFKTTTPSALTQTLIDKMNRLNDQIAQRAFSIFERNGRRDGHDLEDWLQAEADFLNPVPIQMVESENQLTVRAAVPGFSEKEIEILAEPGRLLITGKTEEKVEEPRKKAIYSEVSMHEIARSVQLPEEIDTEKVNAELKNGILELSMQKAKPARMLMAKAA